MNKKGEINIERDTFTTFWGFLKKKKLLQHDLFCMNVCAFGVINNLLHECLVYRYLFPPKNHIYFRKYDFSRSNKSLYLPHHYGMNV